MTYTSNYSPTIIPYVNTGLTDSGPHITQLKTYITKVFNKFLRDKINFAKDITTDCNWGDFKDCYDLDKMITKVESKVLDWNNDK